LGYVDGSGASKRKSPGSAALTFVLSSSIQGAPSAKLWKSLRDCGKRRCLWYGEAADLDVGTERKIGDSNGGGRSLGRTLLRRAFPLAGIITGQMVEFSGARQSATVSSPTIRSRAVVTAVLLR